MRFLVSHTKWRICVFLYLISIFHFHIFHLFIAATNTYLLRGTFYYHYNVFKLVEVTQSCETTAASSKFGLYTSYSLNFSRLLLSLKEAAETQDIHPRDQALITML